MPCLAYCMQAWSLHSTTSTFVMHLLRCLALQVGALQKELDETGTELQRVTRMLKLADPDGYFR